MEDLNVVDSINNAGSWLVRNQALLLSYAVNIVAALAIIIVGLIVARIVSNTVNRLMRARHTEATGNIINFSREPVRRNEFIIGVAYDADIDKVKQLLTNIIESDERILKDREMTVRLNELGASSVNYVVRVWSKSSDLQSVYWDVLERIKRDFDANGIGFPYPQMDVHVIRPQEKTE